jgi:hypothetical protein
MMSTHGNAPSSSAHQFWRGNAAFDLNVALFECAEQLVAVLERQQRPELAHLLVLNRSRLTQLAFDALAVNDRDFLDVVAAELGRERAVASSCVSF